NPTPCHNLPMMRAWALLSLAALPLFPQSRNPVKWTVTPESASVSPGGLVPLKFRATIDSGWHIYSLTNPEGGPTPTTIKVIPPHPAVARLRLYSQKPHTKYDANFQMNVEALEGDVTLLGALEIAGEAQPGEVEAPLLIRYQACTDKECLPKKLTVPVKLRVQPGVASAAWSLPPDYLEATGPSKAASQPAQQKSDAPPQELGPFLAVAFGFGLAAIFTPCVFPMIPITMSFFLQRPGATRGDSVRQAVLFCLGIVVLFTVMGAAVTALAGPFGVVQLGSNPWVNGFIALVFVTFGLSLLGAFEITLPSGLLTRMNQASERGGITGTLLMGLTFSLTSFACVGPFVGTLLAGSVQGGGVQPLLGMMAFSSGLAAPFFALALFPSWLQRMPRSGGWLARVKVVLGFIILAAALKYVSSVDQVLQWNVLTRERFLAFWIVLFALPGLYLLGMLRMEGIRQDETVGVGRTLAGAIFLIFAISLFPGMFGGGLGELDAYIPLRAESAAVSGSSTATSVWMKNDLEGALTRARQENKQVMVNFTGYACTNCHWMKANMFTRPQVAQALGNYVLVELYTDGTDAVSEANQKLQETQFSTVAIPFYAIFDADRRVVGTFAGLTRSESDFLTFLKKS
ncbi:MAG TPA: cytochrome c biogenesis protein CcdA, partial [Bryobacteraceae bacterium]|nr:cytochrome c biogenesis protein CcdA [Bryobacteraceae bacterium]